MLQTFHRIPAPSTCCTQASDQLIVDPEPLDDRADRISLNGGIADRTINKMRTSFYINMIVYEYRRCHSYTNDLEHTV